MKEKHVHAKETQYVKKTSSNIPNATGSKPTSDKASTSASVTDQSKKYTHSNKEKVPTDQQKGVPPHPTAPPDQDKDPHPPSDLEKDIEKDVPHPVWINLTPSPH